MDNEPAAIEAAELTEEQKAAEYEKVKDDVKAAELALLQGKITNEQFNAILDADVAKRDANTNTSTNKQPVDE
ncbi:hypothetical protein Barb6_02305 [Bacteroidales bacterium Barb6]|nr:hypothetical protein Barb6_02305 [Bacteroidales bacterium Barb6]